MTSPRPIAVKPWLTSPDSDSSQPQMIPAATSGMTCGRNRTVREIVPEPSRCDPLDDARGDEPERHRDEAEEQHQPERVEDRPDEIGIAQHGRVVRQPDPGRRADAVPAIERVLDRQGERQEDEQRRTSPARAPRTATRPWSAGGSPVARGSARRAADEQPGPSDLVDHRPSAGFVGGLAQRFSSFSYSAWTAFEESGGVLLGRRPSSGARASSPGRRSRPSRWR